MNENNAKAFNFSRKSVFIFVRTLNNQNVFRAKTQQMLLIPHNFTLNTGRAALKHLNVLYVLLYLLKETVLLQLNMLSYSCVLLKDSGV